MNKKLFHLLVVSHISSASAAEKLDRVGGKEIPPGAVLMCDEHVVGEASGKPLHIDWQAFGANGGAGEIVQFYQSQFRRPPVLESDGQSYTWTIKGENNELKYSVKAPSAAGPWAGCTIPPFNLKAVVLISNAIGTKGR
ncbi:hypothetical protein MJ904_18755 [Massilia sp. MB5]|uniref:hypothetical protein n=1 Tax=Massilia sp. MB5 TaxID=2919578 RepID=UPI001F0E5121|nr:hypothetical protein [Massilia sp. MB5]UMR29123.1 hypothetical protein MJ904_18755 [Massilia sp. MB5]